MIVKVIVTGGRDYSDYERLSAELSKFEPDLIIQGGATGADALALRFANERGVKFETYPAQWGKYGKSAGPLRNEEMLKAHPDAVVLAFPGGRGTAHCKQAARYLGHTVYEVLP